MLVSALPIDIFLRETEESESDDPGNKARCTKHQSLVCSPAADAVGELAPATINLNVNDEMVECQ